MKIIRSTVLFVILALPVYSWAGIKWVDIGVNGLTCSMCTRSVEESIIRLNFVDSVVMSLEKTEGRVYLNSTRLVDLKKIAKAVVDAGFSVRFVRLEVDFKGMTIASNGTFRIQGQEYIWMDYKVGGTAGHDVTLKLVDDYFLPRKEGTEWKKKIEASNASPGEKAFHVVLD